MQTLVGVSILLLAASSSLAVELPRWNPAQTRLDAPTSQHGQASLLLSSWGLGNRFQFAELASANVTTTDVLEHLGDYSALLVVVAGQTAPQRRQKDAGQPFLELIGSNASSATWLPVAAVNHAAEVLEGVLGRPLFPLRVEVRDFHPSAPGWSPGRPLAVYDVSSGSIVVDTRLQANAVGLPGQLTERFASSLMEQLAHFVQRDMPQQLQDTRLAWLADVGPRAAAAAAGVAIASAVPLWFCISCLIVLGTAAPFVFNIALGAIASQLCERYALPADECFDLWIGFFALAAILSFASVFPIIKACRLTECTRGPGGLA